MSGDTSTRRRPIVRRRHRSNPDTPWTIFTIILGSVCALGLVYLAFSLLEASLARQDRANQEQLVWTCNGNGGADTCQLIGKA